MDIKWVKDKHKKIRSASTAILLTWVLAKFLFGVGLGVLLVVYVGSITTNQWLTAGWGLVALSVILGIAAATKISK